MKQNVIISRVLKTDGAAAVEYLTKSAAGYSWNNSRRAAVVVVPDSPAAAVAADFLFWDYDSDYQYNTIKTRRAVSAS